MNKLVNAQSEIPSDWLVHLEPEFSKNYMQQLYHFLEIQIKNNKKIYPSTQNFYKALQLTPFNSVKAVIIGQDPYHGPDQAHGLSFSVKPGIKIPPSLQNIFKELKSDLGVSPPSHGYLESWAKQGVLLLNNVLSVEAHQAASHKGQGWEYFTDKIVEVLNNECENIVFFLWGSHAQKKGSNIDPKRHLILKAPHPSPLSSYRGFFGCKHFSKCNKYLQKKSIPPINWTP